jgi:hypothetical protein
MSKKTVPHFFSVMMACAVMLALASQAAVASPILYFSGSLANDDGIAWTDFSLIESTSFTARTRSFGSGGFAPVLSLFALDDTQDLLQIAIGSSNTCASPGAGRQSGGLCWDAFFSTGLVAGNYRLVVSQDGNVPNGAGFADGFSQTGNPHYTGQNYLNDPSYSFVNFDGSQRTRMFEVAFQGDSLVPLPEPGMLVLLGIGMAALAQAQRRSRKYTAGEGAQ